MAIDKVVDPSIAIGAYAKGADIGQRSPGAGDDGIRFSDYLEGKTRESIQTLRRGEEMSARAITDDADLTDVVQAVTAAELTLQTVVAVRDRVVAAYQEVMRMPM